MKNLLLLLFAFLFFSAKGQIYTVDGNIPIILSSGHGGVTKGKYNKRKCTGDDNCTRDVNTNEILKEINNEFRLRYGRQLNIVFNNLHRSIVDTNRPAREAYVDQDAGKIYHTYHYFITKYFVNNFYSDSLVLYIDIHGHSGKDILLGYNVSQNTIVSDTLNRVKYSTLNNIDLDLQYSLFYLGDYLNNLGYSSWPRHTTYTPTRYFNGGYSIETYMDMPNSLCVQVELPYSIRKTAKSRKQFAKDFVEIIYNYYYNLNKLRKNF